MFFSNINIMTEMICRLCLNDTKLIDIFDDRLTNSEQLRICVLLGTGVEICHDDIVTKYICQYCSDIAVFLYKYRKKALANDKALKELSNQHFIEPLAETSDIVDFNNTTLKLLSEDGEEGNNDDNDDNDEVLSETRFHFYKKSDECKNLAIHPTVIQLIKKFPKLKIPNHLLKRNIQPTVLLDSTNVTNWKPEPKDVVSVVQQEISDLEKFKLKCPGITIRRVTENIENDAAKEQSVKITKITQESLQISDSVQKKRKSSESSSENVSKKSKIHEPKQQEDTLKVKISKKRIQQMAPVKKEENILKLLLKNLNSTKSTPKEYSISARPITESTSSDVPNEDVNSSLETRKRTGISPTVFTATKATTSENDTEKIKPRILSNIQLFDSESDHYDDESVGVDDSNAGTLLDTIEEEIVLNCTICNKMFNTKQQLKSHERFHRRCLVCEAVFRSVEALKCHQRDICFKSVIANPPNLELTKVDEDLEMLNLYPNALLPFKRKAKVSANQTCNADDVFCISDDDDDDVKVVNNAGDSVDNYLSKNREFQHICSVFRKYKNVRFPMFLKDKYAETKPEVRIVYDTKSQVILEDLAPELKNYRIPVELLYKTSSYCYVSYAKKPERPTVENYSWANEPVVKLSVRKRTRNKSSILSKLLSENRSTEYLHQNSIFYGLQVDPEDTEVAVPSISPVQNTLPINDDKTSSVKDKCSSNQVGSVEVNDPEVIFEEVVPVPSTSGTKQDKPVQPAKECPFSLRVKTPWELNTLK